MHGKTEREHYLCKVYLNVYQKLKHGEGSSAVVYLNNRCEIQYMKPVPLYILWVTGIIFIRDYKKKGLDEEIITCELLNLLNWLCLSLSSLLAIFACKVYSNCPPQIHTLPAVDCFKSQLETYLLMFQISINNVPVYITFLECFEPSWGKC